MSAGHESLKPRVDVMQPWLPCNRPAQPTAVRQQLLPPTDLPASGMRRTPLAHRTAALHRAVGWVATAEQQLFIQLLACSFSTLHSSIVAMRQLLSVSPCPSQLAAAL